MREEQWRQVLPRFRRRSNAEGDFEGATDMRRSFEALSYLVKDVLREDPLSGHCFVFFGRSRDKVKVLYFDRTGFAIWYKELQAGTFTIPTTRELTHAELMCVLDGIEIAGIRGKKRFLLQSSGATTTTM